MTILVTGGAGYIGSHAVRQLLARGEKVVVVDNLFRGHKESLPAEVDFYEVDLIEQSQLEEIIKKHSIAAVIHFAALAYVGESVGDPYWYYTNNTAGTLSLLKAMESCGLKKIVFSSTCATYGVPDDLPILESTHQEPINPYGWSKLFVERMLMDKLVMDPEFSFTALRYFNVAGCSLSGEVGEDHQPETHLIPLVLETALGQREQIKVFGTDYPTPDGTCIRDYVHVEDLCRAHLLALDSMKSGEGRFFNLGIGKGYSVNEVIESARRVTGKEIPVAYDERRPGDPPALYCNADKIKNELGWVPEIKELDDIIASAWNWFKDHPNGYEG
ncbi:MAG: UDP-glucose 4-epimerase GalE [Planctomycetaceae bacterium]